MSLPLRIDESVARYRIVGTLGAGVAEEGTVYVPLGSLQRQIDRPGEVDRVLVSALIKPGFPPAPDAQRNPEAFEQWACTPYVTSVAYDLDRSVPGVEARPVTQLVEAEGRVVHRVNLLMLLLALAAITGAGLGVMSTMMASVVERTREFALQRALGASRGALLLQLALEGLLIGALGGVLGSAIGATLAQVAGRAAFGFAVPVQPLVWLLGVCVALVVAAIGLWVPLRMATAVQPAQGLQE